ncbi:MAG TPA: lipopolysaccharide biosynthesis protein [Sphingomicrobium sp.]|nr:lipopolysaccharide biosynthesis protein [Sphingomicrobium sp.]
MNLITGSIRNVLRNAGWILGSKGVNAIFSLAYMAIVTRTLGVDRFGQFALVLGAAKGVELLVAFQTWQIVVRYGIPHLHAGRSTALAHVVRFTMWLDASAALVAAPIVLVTMIALGGHFGWDAGFIQQAAACGLLFVFAAYSTPLGVLRMYDRFGTAAMADAVAPIVRCLGVLVVWISGPNVIGFIAALGLAELLTAAVYWWLALRLPGMTWRLDQPLKWRDLADANQGIGSYAVTTNLTSTLDAFGNQAGVILVGLLLTPAAAGGFRLARQIGQSLNKLSQTLARPIFLEFIRSRADDDASTQFHTLLRQIIRLSGIGAGVVVVSLLLLGQPALLLVGGRQFLWVYPILLLLGTSAAFEFATLSFEPALVALGRPGTALKLRFVSTVVFLAITVALTPLLGAIGAGVAALVSSILSSLMLWVAISRLRTHEITDPNHRMTEAIDRTD